MPAKPVVATTSATNPKTPIDRCKANDEANDVFNASSKIRHNAFSLVGSIAKSNAQADRPSQNTDVVRVGNCFDRIINDVEDQILHNFADAAGR